MSDKLFVIIKNGHYWRPASRGYTSNRISAGHYTLKEAKEVCDHPNSSCKYQPISELFSLAELSEIESNIKLIRRQIELSEATNDQL